MNGSVGAINTRIASARQESWTRGKSNNHSEDVKKGGSRSREEDTEKREKAADNMIVLA